VNVDLSLMPGNIALVSVSVLVTAVTVNHNFGVVSVMAETAKIGFEFVSDVQIADKLFSSFGQDILDSLFWTAAEPRGRRREHIGVLPHLALAVVYVCIFSLLPQCNIVHSARPFSFPPQSCQ